MAILSQISICGSSDMKVQRKKQENKIWIFQRKNSDDEVWTLYFYIFRTPSDLNFPGIFKCR